ncbi:transporter substrate-binding domain-containing protein [Pigmentibacter sp. JX0631]|uniref:substrate-binding periplasmic protein n=1 Tax=Pigmentibacter sp. JX0631 TaxID=2976982 RepID=UPI00246838EB|nr:transporter substrate-binding domain-containing protein [Pigmentibacter sp. JX0631]WGL58620.1 transporter substrate-binding domain-containing protein [Pigmentibacter sp. JX0631]
MEKKLFLFFVTLFIYFPSTYSNELETINIDYIIRPPYFISANNDGELSDGEIYRIVTKIFKNTNIPFEFKKVPFIRTYQTIKENKIKVCSPSSFKTKEREEFAIFSKSIFQDKKTVIIYRFDNDIISKFNKTDDFLKQNDLKLLVKIGFSYGTFIDEKVLKFKKISLAETKSQEAENVTFTSSDNNLMLEDILTRKADYMFIGRNEAEYLLNVNSEFNKKLKIKDLIDVPNGEKRYMMCSKIVGNEIIEKINKEIDKLVK